MSDLQKPQNSAIHLLKLIQEQKLDPVLLTSHQRRICIRFLLQDKKYTPQEIADILKVHNTTVYRTKEKIQKQNMWMLEEIDERKFALDLIQTAISASSRLFRQNKNKDAWQVEKECVEMLQSLGFIKRKPIAFEGSITLTEMLKLANGAPEDEHHFLGSAGNGAASHAANGSSQLS